VPAVLIHEYLLAADKELDLSDPGRAADWLKERPWGFTGGAPDLTNWTAYLHALRALARRLSGKKAAREADDDWQTPDLIAGYFLRRFVLWPAVGPAKKGGAGGSPLWGGVRLTPRTFRGLQVFPTYQPPDRPPGQRVVAAVELRADHPNSVVFWFCGGELFWQMAFRSLLANEGPAVCSRCGEQLVATKKAGKRSRRKLCKRCQYKDWYDRQPVEKKRERWNRDYNTYRRGK
jgi:hypothetical protein